MSPASIIRCPFFHRGPITSNSNCSTRKVHCETSYDFLAFVANPELRDSMRLVQRYSLEPFMTPCQFFYTWVVIKFYHTMTFRRVPRSIVNIAAVFHFPIVLANSVDYKLWPHPLPRERVHILSKDITAGSILFQRQLPPSMLLIDHILRSNLFPL